MISSHQPRKRFGQNFLIDEAVITAIVSAFAPRPGQHVLEIGPGRGALTAGLLHRLDSLHGIEIDRDLAADLRGQAALSRLNLVIGDALAVDFNQFPRPLRVIGNLPYNVATAILLRLTEIQPDLVDIHVMLQKEVVERLGAQRATKAYGRLAVLTQYLFEVEQLFDVPPQAFFPRPKVTSTVVRLIPKALAPTSLAILPMLSKVVQVAFSQRRKTLRNTIKPLFNQYELETLAIDPQTRPEMLGIDQYTRLAEALSARIV